VAGQFIFGGLNTQNAPLTAYSANPPSATKSAVDAAFLGAFGTSQTSADAAAIGGTDMPSFLDNTFAPLVTGAGYTAAWSGASDATITSRIAPEQTIQSSLSANAPAFQKLAQAYTMISEFGGSPLSADASQAAIGAAATLVSSAITDLVQMQAGVGVSQSAVSAANDSMSAQVNLLSTETATMSELSDLDTYDLSNKITTLQTQIQASYQLTAKLQQMSLVNYL
jgi:flagellar hook-associated protein 3 FlgL